MSMKRRSAADQPAAPAAASPPSAVADFFTSDTALSRVIDRDSLPGGGAPRGTKGASGAACPRPSAGQRVRLVGRPGVYAQAVGMVIGEEGTPREKTLCSLLATRPLACLPNPTGAMLGKMGHFKAKMGKDDAWDAVAAEAARTVPGRENGGNCDIKNLSTGCTVYFPVFVDGANLSMGDMHFSQGDGEVSFCGAIEMSGFLELRCTVIKGGMTMLPVVGPSPLCVNPIFEIGPLEPRFSEFLVFEGISVDEKGAQHYLDASLAYKRAVLNAIKYLAQFGYTEEQIYLLLSCCPCEGRISGIVDVPNAVATLAIPLAIFDRDVRPKAGAVLEALARGVSVKKVGRDCARQTDAPPEPSDPRLA